MAGAPRGWLWHHARAVAARKPSRSRRRSTRRNRRGRWARLRPWLLLVVGIGIAFGVTSFVLLDARVRSQFGQTQWQLPAHVYTRPLALYDGRDIGRDMLIRHLEAVGYRRGGALERPGHYRVEGRLVRIHTRAFAGPRERSPARRINVRFDGDRIARVDTLQGGAAIARIEPERMGSIQPGRREDRILVRLDRVPDQLVETLIAVEDRGFREHWGGQPTSAPGARCRAAARSRSSWSRTSSCRTSRRCRASSPRR